MTCGLGQAGLPADWLLRRLRRVRAEGWVSHGCHLLHERAAEVQVLEAAHGEELAAIRAWLKWAWAYEREHGRDTLLRLDAPGVQEILSSVNPMLEEMGLPKYPRVQVAAE